MSDATATESPPRRLRGWGAALGLALATLLFSALQPALLIFVPLAVLLVALPPRRPGLVVGGLVLLWLGLSGSTGTPIWYLERGWALLLAAWFLAVGVLWPQRSFIVRGLAAVGATSATAALLMLVRRSGFAQLDAVIGERLRVSAQQTLEAWRPIVGFERVSGEMAQALYAFVDLQALVFPALLALGSLAGLGVAWFAYRRLAFGEAAPLAPLREFRFPDDLVWLLIAGIVLLVLPLGAVAQRAGTNLLAFMTALYALRGIAVLLVVAGAPGPLGIMIGGVLFLLLYPLVMATTVLVGVTDTWLDIRARRAAAPPS